MTSQTVFQAHIDYLQYLDADGIAQQPLPAWCEQLDLLRDYYRQMVLARQFDAKAVALQRTGQLGTYPSALGAEAIDIVCGKRLQSDDVLVPYYRNHALQAMRGLPWSDILRYWGGDERGSANPKMGQDLPNCVTIATQCLHACGVSVAVKMRQQTRAVLTLIGDGGTSKGDFMEALNVAGVWQLPVVFVINNNQWAISVPRSKQCFAPTLAQKGIAAGIRSEQVDGNDVIALHESLEQALQRAREGKGPSLIEAISYRLCDHTTADDASRYREAQALKEAWQRDPIKRLKHWLIDQGGWDDTQESAWLQEANTLVQREVEDYLNTPAAAATDMFDYLYAELPEHIQQQRQQLQQKLAGEEV